MEGMHPFSIASLTSPQKPPSCLNKTGLDIAKCRMQPVKNVQEVSQTATCMDITKFRMNEIYMNQHLQQEKANHDKTKTQNRYGDDPFLQQTALWPFVDLMSLGFPDLSTDLSGILNTSSETSSLHATGSAEPRSFHTPSSSHGSSSPPVDFSDSGLGSSLSASSLNVSVSSLPKDNNSLLSEEQQSPGQQSPVQQSPVQQSPGKHSAKCENKITDNIPSSSLLKKCDENINSISCGIKTERDGNSSSISSNSSSSNNKNNNTNKCSDSSSSTSSEDKDSKPCHSYVALISRAILSCPEKLMVLSDIYQHVMDNYSYYNNGQRAWRNSIRHNLSLNECFMKAGRAENGKGHYWCIHPSCLEDFTKGDYRRRHARRRARTLAQRHALNISALPYSYRCNLGYVPMSSSPLAGLSYPMGNLHGNMLPSNPSSSFLGQRSCHSPLTSSPVNQSTPYSMKGYPISPVQGYSTSPLQGNTMSPIQGFASSPVQGYPTCDVIHSNRGAGYMTQLYTRETQGMTSLNIPPITTGRHPVTCGSQSTQNSYLQQSSTSVAMNNMDSLGLSMDTHVPSPYYSPMSHRTSPTSRYSPYPSMR